MLLNAKLHDVNYGSFKSMWYKLLVLGIYFPLIKQANSIKKWPCKWDVRHLLILILEYKLK